MIALGVSCIVLGLAFLFSGLIFLPLPSLPRRAHENTDDADEPT
jgi:hypothetical protein